MTARDVLQNLYDANRGQLDKVRVAEEGSTVTISALASYELERPFFFAWGARRDPRMSASMAKGLRSPHHACCATSM